MISELPRINSRACLLLTAAALVMALPSGRVHSQLAPPASDPVTALQAIATANDDLLKRQDDSLKDLTEMTTTAHEIRIFSRRG